MTPLDVDCPLCYERAGHHCRTPSGAYTEHAARRDAAGVPAPHRQRYCETCKRTHSAFYRGEHKAPTENRMEAFRQAWFKAWPA